MPALHGRFFAAGLCALDRGEAVGTSSGNREEPASELPDEGEAETGADSDELGPLLAAIGEEVSLRAEAMRNLVRSSFDARMRYTRQTGPPHELAARIAGLKQEMRAALAAIGINADLERRGRQAAVRRERAGARRPKFRRRSPPTGPPAPRPF